MTKDVIELAREAGLIRKDRNPREASMAQIDNFAALVAARERERLTSAAMESASKAIDAAVSMTIERCALVALNQPRVWDAHAKSPQQRIAAAIRALNTEGDGHDRS